MKISACVIVKNEEKNLSRWLDSMKRIADELVVVDTGSSDGTVALAEKAGARVEHFEWIHDFSAAKNYAIEKAEGDWILMLDADEYFLPADCPEVRAAIEKYHRNRAVAGLIFQLVNIDRATGQDMGSAGGVVRAFRNVSWMRYVGKIHEEIRNLSGKGMRIVQYVKDAVIYHTGYSADVIRDKVRRNLELLLQQEEKRDIDDFYLADCYYSLGRHEEAIECLQRFIPLGIPILGMENKPYTLLIHSLMLTGRSAEEIYGVLDEALKKYPKAAEFYMMHGIEDWICGDYVAAERYHLHGIEVYRRELKKGAEVRMASHSVNFLPAACFQLGMISAWKGNSRSAEEYLAEVLRLQPRNRAAVEKLCCLFRGTPLKKLADYFNRLYDGKRDGEFLSGIFAEKGLGEAALFYEGLSGKVLLDSMERYLLAGDLSGAAVAMETAIGRGI